MWAVLLQTDRGQGISLALKLFLRAGAVSKGQRAGPAFLAKLPAGRPRLARSPSWGLSSQTHTNRKLTGALISAS